MHPPASPEHDRTGINNALSLLAIPLHFQRGQSVYAVTPGSGSRTGFRRPTMHNGTPNTLPSRNEAWGFFGTIRHHAEPNHAWALAMGAIAKTTDCPEEAVRDFLDSRYGRHLADDVANGLFSGRDLPAAINSAIERWMEWRIDARIERELGIPRGLPYLTEFVCMHEALLDATA
jgi:hypothetical protein